MQVYELITCVRRANENAGNLISGVQFLINIYIQPFSKTFSSRSIYIEVYFCLAERGQACMTNFLLLNVRKVSS